MESQRERTGMETFVLLVKFWSAIIYFPVDAPRDKCAHFREINGTAAAFQYLQKNYNPTASSFLRPSTGKYR